MSTPPRISSREARYLQLDRLREDQGNPILPSANAGEEEFLSIPHVTVDNRLPLVPTQDGRPQWNATWRRHLDFIATPPRKPLKSALLELSPPMASNFGTATSEGPDLPKLPDLSKLPVGEKLPNVNKGIVSILSSRQANLEDAVQNLMDKQYEYFDFVKTRDELRAVEAQRFESKLEALSADFRDLNIQLAAKSLNVNTAESQAVGLGSVTKAQLPNFEIKPPALKLETVKMPTFTGIMDPIGPTQFLRDLDLLKQSHNFSDEVFINSWVPSLLRRGASSWFISNRHLFTTWSNFKIAFISRFQSRRHNFDVLSALSAIRQADDEQFSKYFSRCESVLLKADDSLGEDFKIGAIIHGLNAKLYHKVMHQEFDSLEQLCETIVSIENRLKLWRTEPRKNKQLNTGNGFKNLGNDKGKKRPWCSIHKMFGHSDDQCFKRKEFLSAEKQTSVKSFSNNGQSRGGRQNGARPKDGRAWSGQHHPDRVPKPVFSSNPAFQAVVQDGLDPEAPNFYSNPNGSPSLGQPGC